MDDLDRMKKAWATCHGSTSNDNDDNFIPYLTNMSKKTQFIVASAVGPHNTRSRGPLPSISQRSSFIGTFME
jgi:hypothetical protein